MSGKYFCIAPWIHLHAWPTGKVYPCCMTPEDKPVADLSRSTLQEAWNSPKMRALRLRMLSDQPSTECRRCEEHESCGSFSHRQHLNSRFSEHFPKAHQTSADGSVAEISMLYWDIRFSNLCNFRCRTCGPELSSGWSEDHKSLQRFSFRKRGLLQIDLWDQLKPHLQRAEEIYFAGGEPMLMEDHYKILNELIRLKRFDVRLRYNTNFSMLRWKDHDILSLWKQFSSIEVGASFDAMGAAAEYIRKGTSWTRIESHVARLKAEAPHVRFFVNPTLSALNILSLPDFHLTCVERGWIGIDDFVINPLNDPPAYRLDILPDSLRNKVLHRYEMHLQNLRKSKASLETQERFSSVVRLIQRQPFSAKGRERFRSLTRKLDTLRGESFSAVFPELVELLD